MKKLLFLLAFLLTGIVAAWSQPSTSYSFSNKAGFYEELTNPILVGTSYTGAAIMSKSFDDLDIGFNFVYNDSIFKKFSIASRGYLTFGSIHAIGIPTNDGYAMTNSTLNHLIGAVIQYGFAFTDSSSIGYQLSGNAPNRVLTVQYKNMLYSTTSSDDASSIINYQIKLYETTNVAEFVFGKWVIAEGKSTTVKIGLKGTSTDFHTRTTTTDWTQTTKSTSTTNACTWSRSSYPAAGLTFTFTPSAACEAPTAQPTNLVLTPTTTNVSGKFTKSASADHYLVIETTNETLNTIPGNTKNYSAGASIGNGYVVASGTDSIFTFSNSVKANTKYYFHIIGYNSYCASGPVYNTINPLSGNTVTAPEAPGGIVINSTDFNNIKLTATSNSLSNPILIAVTDTVAVNSSNQNLETGAFGTPRADLKVGDVVAGGGKIIFKGNPSDITLNNLTENKVYFFRAWSYNAAGLCSSTTQDASAITYGKVPYYQDYSSMPLYSTPVGWENGGALAFRTSTIKGVFSTASVYDLECSVTSPNTSDGTLNYVTTQKIKLGNRPNKLSFKYNMLAVGNYGSTSIYTTWAEKDSFNIQVSSDGVNYTTVMSINSTNPEVFTSKTEAKSKSVRLDGLEGKIVNVRLYYRTQSKAKLYISPISIEEVCDVPTNIKVDESTLTPTSADISWTGYGASYAVRYHKVASNVWDTVKVDQPKVHLKDLTTEVTYEYYVKSLCSAAPGDTSAWSSPYTFKTKKITCFVPSNIKANNITYKSAIVSWTGTAAKYEVDYRTTSSSKWIAVDTITQPSFKITGLTAQTDYTYKVRSICADRDSSSWSELQTFKTMAVPECTTPTNLSSNSITTNSVTLSWDADGGNLRWNLRYREGAVTSWTSISDLTKKTYTIQGLLPKTIYLWSVKATCEDGYTSGWATQGTFTTLIDGIKDILGSTLKVYTTGGMMHLINSEHTYVRKIEIYSEEGRLLQSYNVNSDENVVVNTNLNKGFVLVKVIGNSDYGMYKLLIR
jgi:hypothetical protein